MESALTSVAISGSSVITGILLGVIALDLVLPTMPLIGLGFGLVFGCDGGMATMVALFIYSLYAVFMVDVINGLAGMVITGVGLLTEMAFCLHPPQPDLPRDWEMMNVQKLLKASRS